MNKLLALAMPLLLSLTACVHEVSIGPTPPSTLDTSLRVSGVGQAVTITGPGANYGKVGASIYALDAETVPVGQVLASQKLRLTLSTPPQTKLTGPVDAMGLFRGIVTYLPVSCPQGSVTASTPVSYDVPRFYTEIDPRFVGIGKTVLVLPTPLSERARAYLKTGHLIYIDKDVTLSGKTACARIAGEVENTYEVNVALKAGWNILREQDIAQVMNGQRVDQIAVTGGADDYTTERR